MAPRKQFVALNGAMSKGKTSAPLGARFPHLSTISRVSPKTLVPPRLRGVTTSVQPPQQYENQLLQMLTNMKERMKEQEAQSDHGQEQVTLDRKNVIREYEALRQLNNRLHAQIAVSRTLQHDAIRERA